MWGTVIMSNLQTAVIEDYAEEEIQKEIQMEETKVIGTVPAMKERAVKPKKKSRIRTGMYLFVKRTFDIVSSGLLLLILLLVILLCLLIKWLEDIKYPAYRLEIREVPEEELKGKKHKSWITRKDGKVFDCKLIPDKTKKIGEASNPIYTSIRVGKNGKLFKFHKIRSMCPGAEEMKQQLIDAGLNEADPPAFKMARDPRITKFGRFLRKFSIDELPQLWDIFLGRISVVGPRSPLPDEVETYTDKQKRRLEVKGGLLCLWQIQKNRNSLSFDEWLKLDLEYIEKRSLWLDFKIIVKGAWMVLFDHSGE